MKTNPFDTIAQWLSNQHMTASEKRDMREVLMNYATTHPVKSGLLSPYAFKFVGVAFASLAIVLSASIGLTQASTSALPNQSLYGVKLWVEEFQANNQKTPEARIAFENDRIKKRFTEASTLAVNRKLDETTAQVVQAGLEHSRETVRSIAESVQNDNPTLALEAINDLETVFSSNSRVLARIEQNTNQNIGTIVLAAQQSTDRLALEKVKFEQKVALQPNTTTRSSTELKLSLVTEKLKSLPVAEPTTDNTLATNARVATVENAPTADTAPVTMMMTMTATELTASSTDSGTGTASTTAPAANAKTIADAKATTAASVTAPSVPLTADQLVAGAIQKINEGAYSEALVALQKAEQVIDEATMTRNLEKTYNIAQ